MRSYLLWWLPAESSFTTALAKIMFGDCGTIGDPIAFEMVASKKPGLWPLAVNCCLQNDFDVSR